MIKNNYYDQDPSQFGVSEEVTTRKFIKRRFLINFVSVYVSEFPLSVNKIHLVRHNHSRWTKSAALWRLDPLVIGLSGDRAIWRDRAIWLTQTLWAVSSLARKCCHVCRMINPLLTRSFPLKWAQSFFFTSTVKVKILTIAHMSCFLTQSSL